MLIKLLFTYYEYLQSIFITESSLTQIPEEPSEAVVDGTEETTEMHDGTDEVADGNDQEIAEEQSS